MNTNLPDDAELHSQATTYAARHRVSYAEALTAVVDVAQRDAPHSKAGERSQEQRADDALDAQAKAHARSQGVSYAEALTAVIEADTGLRHATFSERSPEQVFDARLDAAATTYARSHGVSYSEALDLVSSAGAGAGAVEFREAVQALAEPIEIFRAGVHVDSLGTRRTFNLADLQATADAYDPARHESPLVLGHPENDRPAYGWVNSLQAAPDGRLLMRASKLDPAFAESVKSGHYKKRSASFYQPDDPSNPVPGKWYLKHVAWLGARPPAVKGLADVVFGASELAVTFQL